MASEIQIQTAPAISNANAQAIIRNSSAQVWNGSAFVAWVDANINTYKIGLTEQGTASGFYTGNFPTGITTAGTYSIVVYNEAGGSLVVGDTIIGVGYVDWDGSAVAVVASGEDLTTLAYVKAYLELTVSTYDTLLTSLITAASYSILSYCHRNSFKVNSYSEYIDGAGDYTIDLGNVPVISITTITLEANEAVPEAIAGSSYILDTKRGRIRLKNTSTATRWFRQGFQNVLASYSAGYASIPADLQQACAMIVQSLFIQRGGSLLTTMEKLGDYQATYSRASSFIDDDISIRAILDRYRDWSKVIGG